jgi:heptosyltransferase-2
MALARRLRREDYDLVVDIHNSLRSRIVRWIIGARRTVVIRKRAVARWLLVRFKWNIYRDTPGVAERYLETVKPLGVRDDGKGLALHIPDDVQFETAGRIATLGLNRCEQVVGLCPGARHATKRWPQERFAELGIRIAKKENAKILLFGGPEDRDLCRSIAEAIARGAGAGSVADLSGAFSLLGTAAAFTFCDTVVTNDSGLMHIASAMDRDLVAIFGPTVEEFGFFPGGTKSIVLERRGLYCRPCSHIGRPSCPQGHFRCMVETGVEEVAGRVEEMLGRKHL